MEEEWAEVRGWPDYLVSNFGRVYSVRRDIILKGKHDKDGYHVVTLCKKNNRGYYGVHRLVAFEFIPGYFEGAEVNHIDGIKDNNYEHNLEWETSSGNAKHAYRLGLTKPYPLVKMGYNGDPIRIRILETNELFESIAACAIHIKGDSSTIAKCLKNNGVNFSHRGFHFEYAD